MITGDEGKPMSILEQISDEPCDPEPYIDYLIANYRAYIAYWEALPNDRDEDKPTARECVLHRLWMFVDQLDGIKRKMHRPTREQFLAAREADQ